MNLIEKLNKLNQEQNNKIENINNKINSIINNLPKIEKRIEDLSFKMNDIDDKLLKLKSDLIEKVDLLNKNNEILDIKIETSINELKNKINIQDYIENNQNKIRSIQNTLNVLQSITKKKDLEITNKINEASKSHTEIAKKIANYTNNQEVMFSLINNLVYAKSNFYMDNDSYFHEYKSKDGDGILAKLKKINKNPFERPFIVSLSNRDPYNLLDHNSNSEFCSSNFGDFYVEFKFKEPINLTGFQIVGSDRHFPRCYDIIINGNSFSAFHYVNDTKMKEKPHISKQKLNAKNCKTFKFVQIGPNWDKKNENANFIVLQQIEFFTEENKNGLIKSLNDLNTEKDPHLFPIIVDSNQYSTEDIHILNSTKKICTSNLFNEYCEIKFVNGAVSFEGYRLKLTNSLNKMQGWFLMGKTLLDEEINLTKHSDTSNNSNLLYVSQKVYIPSLLKSITLYKSYDEVNSSKFLQFHNFDIFGSFIKI